MERERLVGVHGDRHGSGYVVAPGLVLTSAHVVGGGPVTVFHPGRPGTTPGTVVWCGTPDGRDDAALVRVDPEFTGVGTAVRWGRAVTDRTGIDCESWGLPDAVQTTGATEAKQVRGHLNAGDRFVGNRYAMTVETPFDDARWAGMSGAPLAVGHLLIGVVARAHNGQLLAVPSYILWRDKDFRAALDPAADRLAPAELDHDTPAPVHRITTPATLLLATQEVVPWQPRPALMAELHEWLNEDGSPVRLVQGPGGQGKTRLALQLGHELDPSWAVWWPRADASAASLSALAEVRVPTLVVVDYAETRTRQLVPLLVAANDRVKVLLLARLRGAWWDELAASDSRITDRLHTARTHDLAVLDDGDPYQSAVRAFAPHLPGTDPAALADRRPESDHVLTVHMTALADLYDQVEAADTAGTAEERVLFHEAHYWQQTAVAQGIADLPGTTRNAAIAIATLIGPSTRAETEAALRTLPELHDQPNLTLSKLTAWLSSLYPATGFLQPDRLAERHVARHATPELLTELVRVVPVHQAVVLLTLLDRIGHAEIGDLVRSDTVDLAVAAIKVITTAQHPEPLLAALERFVTNSGVSVETLMGLRAALPVMSQRLRHVTLVLTGRLVVEHRASGSPDDLAASLHEHGRRLDTLSRREEASIAFREAVDLYRQVATTSEESRADLAVGLNDLARSLMTRGGSDEMLSIAQEAVQIIQVLAVASPERYLGHLIRCLSTLSFALVALDQHDGAAGVLEKAIGLDGRATGPEAGLIRALVATTNGLLASADAEGLAKQLATTRQVVDFMRRFAEDRPDAFLSGLGTCLELLAHALGAGKLHEEAVAAAREAVGIWRSISAPESVSKALIVLANRLFAMGRYEEAAGAFREAALGCAEFGKVRHLRHIAIGLDVVAFELDGLGLHDEAMAATEDAIAIFRELAGDGARLAKSLYHNGKQLGNRGRHEEALARFAEAEGVFVGLAEPTEDVLQIQSANGFHRSVQLCALGRQVEAVDVLQENIDFNRELSEANPEWHRHWMVDGLIKRGQVLGELGRFGEAMDVVSEAIATLRPLAAEQPEKYQSSVQRARKISDWLLEQQSAAD